MNRLFELRQSLSDAKAKGLAILDKADDEGRNLTEAETAEYEAIEARVASLSAEITAAERAQERRRAMEAIAVSLPAAAHRVAALDRVTDEPNPATTGGFRSIGEFAVAVREACNPSGRVIDPRLRAAPSSVNQGGTTSGEGFLLPVQYSTEVWEAVTAVDEIMGRTDVEPTTAREIASPADETTPWGGSGVQAYWRGEGTQMTASKPDTDERRLRLHELYAFVNATEELLEDAPRLEARLTRKAALAIAWKIGESVINGTGAGQPQGWMTSGALVTVAKESGQAAATINDQNILKMASRLMRIPGDAPFWLANPDILPALGALKIGDQPMWVSNLRDAPGGFLLGMPILLSEYGETLGTVGDLQLVSPKGYHAAVRQGGPQMASSMHLFFDYNVTSFRWTFRFGGQPHLKAPIAAQNGSSSKSHFVALATRA